MSDTSENLKLRSIVAEAMHHSGQDRSKVLDRLCAGDVELRRMAGGLVEAQDAVRQNIERLLNFSEDDLAAATRGGFTPAEQTQDDAAPSQGTTTERADRSRQSSSSPSGSPEIAGYSPIRILGEGGMGVVWEAVQNSTRRSVALKLMLDNRGSTSAHHRFQREVELAGRLVHPFIARIYDSGVDRRSFYYAMELVIGTPLTHFARERNLSTRELVELFRKVCDGVGHAHAHGVIHRDLKPSNILVDGSGEPKLLDFGLAKFIREEGEDLAGNMTVSGAIMGTPAYMSPEQADGDTKGADTRGDVYTLGVIFFELLTGRMPHDTSGTATSLIRRIVEDEPKRLRQVRPELDGELEAIILRCLTKKPDDRYTSAKELSDELGRYLRGEPITAHAATAVYILRKQIARHRYRFATAAAIFIATLAGTVFYIISIGHERDQVKGALTVAEGRRQEAQRNLITANEQRAVAIQTLNDTIFNVQREMHNTTVSVETRRRLLDVAAHGLDRLGIALSDPQLQTDRLSLAAVLQMGDLYQTAGRHKEATESYESALKGFQRRQQADPTSAQVRRDLMSAHLRLGRSMQVGDGSADAAKQHLDEALRISEALHAELPTDAEATHDLFAARIAVGDWLLMHKEAAATDAFEKAATIAPPGPDANVAAARLAGAYLTFPNTEPSRLKHASEVLDVAIADARKQIERPDAGPEATHQLAASLSRQAELQLRLENPTAAMDHANEALQKLKNLTQAAPDRADWMSERAAAAFVAARCSAALKSDEQAIRLFEEAQSILVSLDKAGTSSAQDRRLMDECRTRIAKLRAKKSDATLR